MISSKRCRDSAAPTPWAVRRESSYHAAADQLTRTVGHLDLLASGVAMWQWPRIRRLIRAKERV
ncbi:hypothetical protein AB0L65_51015 [Nonomuraea sp. NPDC052116]|uniref:hypothetical protein n=1 Tax=Nonomuraea sp. NPDC052116 TaxID=3155665 RepID=UPI0034312C28